MSLSRVHFFVTPWTVQSMKFSRPEYWSGSLSLPQGIFPNQGSNPGLSHGRRILYLLSHNGSSRIQEWVAYAFSSRSFRPRNPTWVSCIASRFFTKWVIREAQEELWWKTNKQSCSVQFISVAQLCPTLRPHGLQHLRPACPSPTPRVYSNSCPLSACCYQTISTCLTPFSHLLSFPALGAFQRSQFFTQVAKVLGFELQHQSLQWIFRTDFLKQVNNHAIP